jgi:hypothetical protein
LLNIGAIERDIVRVREMLGVFSDDVFGGRPRETRRIATTSDERRREISMVLQTTRIQAAAAEPVAV